MYNYNTKKEKVKSDRKMRSRSKIHL